MSPLQRLIGIRYQFIGDFEHHEISAVTFDRMKSPFYEGEKWAVRRSHSCLSKDGEWEYEPMPSSRDDAFYARCRFDFLEEAMTTFDKQVESCKRAG